MTPEELAACREAYCKEYGYDPEWDVVIDEDFQKAFSAGLFHKQAESAKEIAALKAQVEDFRKDAERYRWLCNKDSLIVERLLEKCEIKTDVDALIDAAITQEKSK